MLIPSSLEYLAADVCKDWLYYVRCLTVVISQGLVGNFSSLVLNSLVATLSGKSYYSLLGALVSKYLIPLSNVQSQIASNLKVAPQSRGSVTLASTDTQVLPVIDPGWLTSPTDQTVAIELYRKIRRIFNTTAFTEVRANDEEYFPGVYFAWSLVFI